MLVVRHASTEPEYTPVLGADVLFRPIDRPMLRRARRAAVAAVGAGDAESDKAVAEQLEELGDALSFALLVEGIAAWRGVVIEIVENGEASAQELTCTPENVELVLSDPLTFEAFDQAYVVPFIMRERERAAPGNGSAASPSGTGEAATQGSDTASSAAPPKTAGGATPARTSPRKPRANAKRKSGAS